MNLLRQDAAIAKWNSCLIVVYFEEWTMRAAVTTLFSFALRFKLSSRPGAGCLEPRAGRANLIGKTCRFDPFATISVSAVHDSM